MKIPDDYNDKKAIEKIVDSFQLKGTLISYLVYQKSIGGKVVSQLFCKTNKLVFVFQINENDIESNYNYSLSDDSVFNYKFLKQTGAIKKEDVLNFRPPLLSVVDSEAVIYRDKTTHFYFEYGRNIVTYVPLKSRDKYRKEWLEIIESKLK